MATSGSVIKSEDSLKDEADDVSWKIMGRTDIFLVGA
jgi:hypothetical protein